MIMDCNVSKGDICLDGTAGNGIDTLHLARLVGEGGKVYSFDIQIEALETTEKFLKEESLQNRVSLIYDSHENLLDHMETNIDFAVYNLGYLPGGDKDLVTLGKTTCKSVLDALSIMNPGGMMVVTAYRGHKGGMEEYLMVREALMNLDQRQYNVFEFSFINQKNNPPVVIGVEIRGGKTWQK